MTRRIAAALLAAAVAAGGVAAGGADARRRKPKPTTLSLRADRHGDLKFDKRTLSARHGVVVIVMKNPRGSGLPHGIAVAGKRVHRRGPNVNPGKTSRVRVTLKKGSYTFYCPFDDHRAAGMRGTLTIR